MIKVIRDRIKTKKIKFKYLHVKGKSSEEKLDQAFDIIFEEILRDKKKI